MPTVFFVDTDPATAENWQRSSHNSAYPTLSFTPFSDVAETAKQINKLQPDFVVIGRLLGTRRGMSVFHDIRIKGCNVGRFMINAPLARQTDAQCTPDELREMLDGSVELAPLPISYAPKSAPQQEPAAPELKEATIHPDGWVRCPHKTGAIQCSKEKYALGDPGKKQCNRCGRYYMAVAAQATTGPDETLTAQAFNTWGDVHCPGCDRVKMDAVKGGRPVQITCENDVCHVTFTGKPFTG
jgi:hypothetical protein